MMSNKLWNIYRLPGCIGKLGLLPSSIYGILLHFIIPWFERPHQPHIWPNLNIQSFLLQTPEKLKSLHKPNLVELSVLFLSKYLFLPLSPPSNVVLKFFNQQQNNILLCELTLLV